MVTSIARQSVIIKCNMQKSVITGLYEYYYGAGLLAGLCGFTIPEDIRPDELKDFLGARKEQAVAGDERTSYLKEILLKYVPAGAYDSQMQELLAWGMSEEHPWEVNVTIPPSAS